MNKTDIENLIRELIEKVAIKVNKINIVEGKNSNTTYSVEVDEPHHFTAREGEALYALNHLVRRIVENRVSLPAKGGVGGGSFLVDINDFQKKKIDAVQAVAHMMSERARYFKSSVEVDPMSSFERRIVHEFLSDAIDLKTESVGIGAGRRVVIKYTGSI
jgi:spoIIIJ-associated protein